MARDLEAKLEDEEYIEPIAYEPNIQSKPPLTSGHLPFNEMGKFPPPDDSVMDTSKFIFDQLKKRIIQERRRYYPDDLVHPVSIDT